MPSNLLQRSSFFHLQESRRLLTGDNLQKTSKCKICNETFQTPEDFSRHLLTHVTNTPDIPPSEKETCRTKLKVEENMVALITNIGRFRCAKCEKEYSTKNSLAKHYETVHQNNRYPCETCKKIFPTMYKLKLHKVVHNPNRMKIECPICLKKILPIWYEPHKRMHKSIDTELFKCDVCNKPLGSSKALHIHKQNGHLKNHRHVCGKCGEKFQSQSTLLLHKHCVAPPRCSFCSKVFKTVTGLGKHLRWHDSKFKKTQCPACLKTPSACTVKDHEMHVLAKGSNAICDVCGKNISRHNFRLHMRTHTGEKPYSCDKCGKSFSNSSTLVAHKRTHTNERPFLCKVCNRGFTKRTPLKVHMRCHTGERPYTCQICSKGFITRGLLKGHMCPGPS